jgi:hypothetical protein
MSSSEKDELLETVCKILGLISGWLNELHIRRS